MRPLSEIIVHCTATQANWMHDQNAAAKVREIRRWHKARGWSDIGYHFLIDRNGAVATGRPLDRVGAHVKGHNTGSIGIALAGGHGSSATDDPSENFTIAQMRALRSLIADLGRDYPTITRVSGHNEYAAKACPGFSVPRWFEVKVPATKAERPGWLAALIEAILAIFRSKK